MTSAEQIGKQMRAARIRAELSLRGLGTLVNIPATTIEGYEAGKRVPVDKFLRIADALNQHTFSVDGNTFTVRRVAVDLPETRTGEQLRLNFTGEYDYSRATVRISPGKITLAFDGAKLPRDRKQQSAIST